MNHGCKHLGMACRLPAAAGLGMRALAQMTALAGLVSTTLPLAMLMLTVVAAPARMVTLVMLAGAPCAGSMRGREVGPGSTPLRISLRICC